MIMMDTILGFFFILSGFSMLFKYKGETTGNKEFPILIIQGRETIPTLFTQAKTM